MPNDFLTQFYRPSNSRYILGVGSTVGSPGAGYGDRLEAACLSLLLVRPPYPLPQVSTQYLIACRIRIKLSLYFDD